jgi:hypothetical protein
MSIMNFEILCFVLATVLVTILILLYNVWIKKDARRRAREMAEPEKFLRR